MKRLCSIAMVTSAALLGPQGEALVAFALSAVAAQTQDRTPAAGQVAVDRVG